MTSRKRADPCSMNGCQSPSYKQSSYCQPHMQKHGYRARMIKRQMARKAPCLAPGCDQRATHIGKPTGYCSAHNKLRYRVKRYNLEVSDLVAMGDACMVCGDGPTGKKGLHIHHDHATGEVHGLMCYRCNIAEGMLATAERAERLLNFMRETTA